MSTRRRAKAAARQQAVADLDTRWALRTGRLPLYWDALDMCPCGRVAWLQPGASTEDRQSFEADGQDHAAYCEVVSA